MSKVFKGLGIFFLVTGALIVVYDTIYSLPDWEGGVMFMGVGLVLAAIAGLIRRSGKKEEE